MQDAGDVHAFHVLSMGMVKKARPAKVRELCNHPADSTKTTNHQPTSDLLLNRRAKYGGVEGEQDSTLDPPAHLMFRSGAGAWLNM